MGNIHPLLTQHGVFYAQPGDLITAQLAEFGARTRNELAMVLNHIEEGETCVDIGAHIGTFAVPIGHKLGDRGKLLAIEGSPAAHTLLRRNVGANGLANRIQTRCTIASDGININFRRMEIDKNSGAGWYLPDSDGPDQASDTKRLLCVHGFANVDFIKIDVEGMEVIILRSLSSILSSKRPKLYIEVVAQQLARFSTSPSDIEDILRPLGYKFYHNTGKRNSTDDYYEKTELTSVECGGPFFDLLALPE